MNGLSVLGQKATQNWQIELDFEPEFKNYKLRFLYFSARHDQRFPWKFKVWKFRIYTQFVNDTTK